MSPKTVFIIGAGASSEVGLPVGSSLKEYLRKYLNFQFDLGRIKSGDPSISEAIRMLVEKNIGVRDYTNEYYSAAIKIRDALPLAPSIDNLIDSHRGDKHIEECSKLGIVRSILEAERNSKLYVKKIGTRVGLNYELLKETWYLSLSKLLNENCNWKELNERIDNVEFIVFNYDRCLEQYLRYSLSEYFKVSDEEVFKLINKIKIYRPYGSIGKLPWQNSSEGIQFGSDPYPRVLLNSLKKIKTFTEGTDPKISNIEEIRRSLSQPGRYVFLGFAFHKINMELLKPKIVTEECEKNCFATTLNISRSDQDVINKQIKNIFGQRTMVNLANSNCYSFFNEYWRSLSF